MLSLCDLPVFISKLSECKQVELSDDFFIILLFLVSMNDTIQLDFQLHLIFIGTTS